MEFEEDEERDWSSPPRQVQERPPSPALSDLTTLTDSSDEGSLSSEESNAAPARKVQPTAPTTPTGRAKCGWSSCRRDWERRWEVKRHVQAHVRDSVGYACTICGDGSFTNDSALSRHINKAHASVASTQPSGPLKRSREEVSGVSAPKRPRIDQRPSPSPPRLALSPAAGMEQHGIVPSLPASASASGSLPFRPTVPSHTQNDPISRPQIQRMMEEYFEREVHVSSG
ncbi:hypothetical protein EXIGLDRAFT_790440 [Exidia glandulosa HHB12029]|uniref:C2H2-type domain-containing protein n=1 Tax=Exidia glandulosa HHB12029 TaxID=1314781 RepID=A0A165HSC6_EXIGL|nr:hypothetical protein EXIGLDRAFT_790440 [Exidia glandulosa HHB12029]